MWRIDRLAFDAPEVQLQEVQVSTSQSTSSEILWLRAMSSALSTEDPEDNSKPPGSWLSCERFPLLEQTLYLQNLKNFSVMLRSSPLRPFPRVLLCPLSIPKVTIVHGVGCSLNLNISYHCSSVSWEYRERLVEYGQAIDPQNLPLSGHPLLQKARTFGLGTPRPPLNKHNKLQHTVPVPSHIKSCTAHWGWEGGPRQKARLFVTEGIWQRKPRFNKQGLYAWLWSGHLSIWCMMPVSSYLREPGRDMWYQYQSFDGHRIWFCTLGP